MQNKILVSITGKTPKDWQEKLKEKEIEVFNSIKNQLRFKAYLEKILWN